ncbi:MAG: hypothetical protein JWM96_857, partial [Alphaproteobacteria bacterium]|nr:hypothetical protein [Alphaproteobacteria bacterium]
ADNPDSPLKAAIFISSVSEPEELFKKRVKELNLIERTFWEYRGFCNRPLLGENVEIAYQFYKECMKSSLLEKAAKIKKPILCIQGTKDELTTIDKTKQFADAFPNPLFKKLEGPDSLFKKIEGGKHALDGPGHFEQAMNHSITFLDKIFNLNTADITDRPFITPIGAEPSSPNSLRRDVA